MTLHALVASVVAAQFVLVSQLEVEDKGISNAALLKEPFQRRLKQQVTPGGKSESSDFGRRSFGC